MKHTFDKPLYLASPYTDPDDKIREIRYHQAMHAVAHLLKLGHIVFSPIVHCHELAKQHDLPKDISFWWRYNRAMLHNSSSLWILTLDGWRSSKGIKKEAAYAIQRKLPIHYLSLAECS